MTQERDGRWRRKISTIACGAMLACGAHPLTPSGPVKPPSLLPSTTTTDPPAPVPSPARAIAPCAVADGITRAAIAAAQTFADLVMRKQLDAAAYTGPAPTDPPSYDVPRFLECYETPQGGWALVLRRAQIAPENERDWSGVWVLDGDLALVHVDRDGHVVERAFNTETNGTVTDGAFFNAAMFGKDSANCCSFLFGGPEALELFDFDGDGEPEVHVAASYGHEGVSERADELLHFHAGQIAPYRNTPELGFHALKDETSDGRPDLRLSRFLNGGIACGSGFPNDGRGLTFLAHSLPDGSFALDDAEARAFARKQCPAPPPTLASFEDVLCARIWGGSAEELERRVRATTTAWDCEAEMAGRAQKPRARTDYELMLSATDTWIPFTLP